MTAMLRRRPVTSAVVAATLLFALFVTVLGGRLGKSATFDPVAVLGRPVPADQMPLMGGTGRLDLGELQGHAVLVNFWNSWCQPCREEAPALATFYARHAQDSDFRMIGILHDDNASTAAKWAASHGMTWQLALDPDSHAALDFGTTGQPETYAISASGVIVGKRAGASTTDDLERLLAMARARAGGTS
jgi:cytochrome c biogenesis protein CcmG/thiol:disulfide interchange protein DsbE